jgi:RimJ/RimL family protein N-acetyltransferase
MTVRKATQADLPQLALLIDEFRKTYHPDAPFDPAMFLDRVTTNLDNPRFIILMLDNGEGMLIGHVVFSNCSAEPVARELVWFTRPTARGKGMPLLRAFRAWAEGLNLRYLFCTIADVNPAMERLGFRQMEVSYFMELPTRALMAD